MDQTDHKLLGLLTSDARTPVAALARKLKLARSTVQDRLAKLEQSGVIRGYTVKVGQQAEPHAVRAQVMLSADPKQTPHVVAELKTMPEVLYLAAISGTYDLIAHVGAATTQRIDEVLDGIGRIRGVTRTMSSIILSVKFER
ncbi:MAG TPA: AsnC family transcriptional regulator [Alphaproteobacteria bacterium]|nr:AsnC family transcriptional regulator [Alphaproteobacteria bacterium]HAJ45474.1 AsnC family transcriptional regulator [Alphaproteobacteria bacterium]